MKGKTKKIIIFLISVLLLTLLFAFAVPRVLSFLMQDTRAEEALALSKRLYDLMPDIEPGFPEDRINISMPSREIEGNDFSAVIDLPLYGASLPIHSSWNKGRSLSLYPCRYSGSMYDGSLIVGGSDAKGQFDFLRIITIGDKVFITDMTGMRYTYAVTHIERLKELSSMQEADLILFAKNSYSFDYTVVYCNIVG